MSKQSYVKSQKQQLLFTVLQVKNYSHNLRVFVVDLGLGLLSHSLCHICDTSIFIGTNSKQSSDYFHVCKCNKILNTFL